MSLRIEVPRMSRQLNQNLFSSELAKSSVKPGIDGNLQISETYIKDFHQQLHQIKMRMKELEMKVQNNEGQIKRVEMSTLQGFERIRSICQRMDKYMKSSLHEVSSKFSSLAGRLTERKAMEVKVEEMIGRHSEVVRGYESKMNQMQKVLSEQELKLVNYQSVLKELMSKRTRL